MHQNFEQWWQRTGRRRRQIVPGRKMDFEEWWLLTYRDRSAEFLVGDAYHAAKSVWRFCAIEAKKRAERDNAAFEAAKAAWNMRDKIEAEEARGRASFECEIASGE